PALHSRPAHSAACTVPPHERDGRLSLTCVCRKLRIEHIGDVARRPWLGLAAFEQQERSNFTPRCTVPAANRDHQIEVECEHEINWARRAKPWRPTWSVKDEQDCWIAKLFAKDDPGVVERALMRLVDSLHSLARRRAARKRSRSACK